MDYSRRLRALRRTLKTKGAEALIVTHLPDVQYLCGFTGSNAALALTASRASLFTDGRYIAQARQEARGVRIHIAIPPQSALKEACAFLASAGVERTWFDPEYTSVASLKVMSKGRRGFFKPLAEPFVSALRIVKDADEVPRIERAALLGCRLFEELLPKIEPGMSEASLAAHLEFAARTSGAAGMSFDTIVASGIRSAMPHGQATIAKLPRKGFMTLDFGVILGNYCSDMTRTLHLGPTSRRERFAYDAVLEAQEAAIAAIRPGVTCGEVDMAARSVLEKAGLAEYFTHSTGHGVGLEIHESPRIAKDQKMELAAGMVVTVEPGVYLPGEFGIRIEDMVLVTENGSRILTPTPKALIEL